MDEKKVREAIKHFKHLKDVLENYLKIPNVEENLGAEIIFIKKDIEVYETVVETLEKQLPKKPIVVSNSLYNKYQCPRCNDYICNGEPICLKCKQPIDWLK